MRPRRVGAALAEAKVFDSKDGWGHAGSVVINTLRIFEELSQAMPPEAARRLASVLGQVCEELQNTVTKAEFKDLQGVVRELAEAQKGTEARLEALTGRVEELAEAQKRTEARVEELAEALKQTNERLDDLIEVVRELTETVRSHDVRLAKVDGRTFELQFREKASAYLGRVMRGTRVISVGDLADDLEGVLTEEEFDEVLRADVILKGRAIVAGARQEVFAVVELSVTLDSSDIERAARRAGLLRKKGWKTLAVAAGEEVSDLLVHKAAGLGVAVMQDGRQFNWDEALAKA